LPFSPNPTTRGAKQGQAGIGVGRLIVAETTTAADDDTFMPFSWLFRHFV
jgi:hypothetical protein